MRITPSHLLTFLAVLVLIPLSVAAKSQQPCAAERSRLAALELEIRRLQTGIPTNKPREVIEEHRRKISEWHQRHDAEVTRLRQLLASSQCQPPPPDPCTVALARLRELAADLRRIEQTPFPTNKPEEILDLRRQRIQQWHRQHDAEVNQLNRLLASSQCPATRVHVTSENGSNVGGAVVFANGTSRGFTDQNGRLDIRPPVTAGTQLVARKLIFESVTGRQQHSAGSNQNWKYRVYITSVRVNTLPPPDPCAVTRARLGTLQGELTGILAGAPRPDKPEEIRAAHRRKVDDWHRLHDVEVNQLTNALANPTCSPPDFNNGSLSLFTISDPSAMQELQLRRNNTLIGLHWLVSAEWDASQEELDGIKERLTATSQFLYNATDGQFLIEQAELFDDAALWEQADLRVYAPPGKFYRAHVDCPRGGFFGSTLWCGDSWMHLARDDDGPTYAHEFGHYGFDLGDEYEDDNADLHCTNSLSSSRGRFASGSPMAACMMWSQWSAPKLCSHRIENPHIGDTRQGDEGCWTHLVGRYDDDARTAANARWTIQTPDTRGTGLDGRIPPIPVNEWLPSTTTDNRSRAGLCRPITQTFLDGGGQPIAGGEVWVLTTYGQILYQGRTTSDDPSTTAVEPAGVATLTGLHVGDTISVVPGLSPLSPVPPIFVTLFTRKVTAAECNLTFSVTRPGGASILSQIQLQPVATRLSVAVAPTSTPGQVQVSVSAEKALRAAPRVSLVPTGQQTERTIPRNLAPQLMRLQPGTKSYVRALQLPPTDVEATIRIDATDSDGNTATALGSIAITQINPTAETDLFSNDGRLSLTIPANTVSGRNYLVISPSAVAAPSLPTGFAVVGGPFNIQASSGEKLSKQAVLRFQLPHSAQQGGGGTSGPNSFAIYRYNSATKQWDNLGGTFIPYPIDVVTLKINQLGTYALVRSV